MRTVNCFSPQSVPARQHTMDASSAPLSQPAPPRRTPILRRGDRHFLVKRLQRQLNQRIVQPDFPALEPLKIDGSFGPKTERRVLLTQFRYLRFQNGIVDPMLWRSLHSGSALIDQFPTLQRYTMGPAVGAVQQLFKTVGLYEGLVDQRFGPETEATVQDFQARQPPPLSSVIAANGIVNGHTWAALEQLAIFYLTT